MELGRGHKPMCGHLQEGGCMVDRLGVVWCLLEQMHCGQHQTMICAVCEYEVPEGMGCILQWACMGVHEHA